MKPWLVLVVPMAMAATFAIAWTAVYVSIMGTNLDYFIEYARLGLSGGERPVSITGAAALMTLIVWAIIALVSSLRRSSRD